MLVCTLTPFCVCKDILCTRRFALRHSEWNLTCSANRPLRSSGTDGHSGRSEQSFHPPPLPPRTPPPINPVPGPHSVVNMNDAELLTHCGQQLMRMRCVYVTIGTDHSV